MIKNFPNRKKPIDWMPNDDNPEFWKALEIASKSPTATELWGDGTTSSGIKVEYTSQLNPIGI
jgi:hypothetical protein